MMRSIRVVVDFYKEVANFEVKEGLTIITYKKFISYISVLFLLASCSEVLVDQNVPRVDEVSSFNLDLADKKTNKGQLRWNCGTIINEDNPPAYIVDGEHWTDGILSGLKPENITHVEVLKNSEKWKKYNLPENISGAVVITIRKNR